MGEQMTAQFQKAVGGIRDIVIFGAMFVATQRVVSTCGHYSERGPQTKGEGLRGWLAKYAPEVNRPTAYRFAQISKGIIDTFSLGRTDLAALLQADASALSAPQKKKREAIEAAISGRSQRQLLLTYGGVRNPEPKARGGARPNTHPKRSGEEQLALLRKDFEWTWGEIRKHFASIEQIYTPVIQSVDAHALIGDCEFLIKKLHPLAK